MNLYSKVYSIIGTLTPLNKDCGNLCNRNCCIGEKVESMILYPNEEKLYEKVEPWYTISDSNITLSNGKHLKLLTCNGTCDRLKRPLACRIFPFMPYLTEDGLLEIRFDLKAISFCPITVKPENYNIDENFIDSLYDAFEILSTDDNVIEFIELLSEDYNNIKSIIK